MKFNKETAQRNNPWKEEIQLLEWGVGSWAGSQSSLIPRNSGAIYLLNKTELFDYINVY